MTQPITSPLWATDALYTSGPDVGLANKVQPSTGLRAQGFRRDTRGPAPRFNHQLNLIGEHLESIVDSAALNWMPNANTGTLDVYSLTRGRIAKGPYNEQDIAHGELLFMFNPVNMYYTAIGAGSWYNAGAHGLNGATGDGWAVGYKSDGTTYAIVGWENQASGAIRATTTLGTSWVAAGSLPVGADFSSGAVGGVHVPTGRFFVCARSQLHYSDTLANVEWPRITTSGFWTGAPPASPLVFGSSDTESAIGIGGAPNVIWTANGSAWAAAPLPGAPSYSVVDLHFSRSHNKWFAMCSNGRLYSTPPGFGAWSLVRDFAGTSYAVGSLGRCVFASVGANLYVTRDLVNWRQMVHIPATFDGVSVWGWEKLVHVNGALVALRHYLNGGSDSGVEYISSQVLPAEFTQVKAW